MQRICWAIVAGAFWPALAMAESGMLDKAFEWLKGDAGNAIQSLQALFGILGSGGLLGGLIWLFRKKQTGDKTRPALPHATRDLATLYYQELNDQCEFLRLDIIATALGQRQVKLKLSDIYQDQHVRLTNADEWDKDRLREANEALPLMQALAKLDGKRLAIRGKVGAGKSSFVNYLVHRIVQSRDSGAVTDLPTTMLNRPVVRLLLRKLGADLQDETEVRGLIWREMEKEAQALIAGGLAADNQPALQPGEFETFWQGFREQFQRQGILLLDGLDEVSESEGRRGRLRQAIGEFSERVPQAFIIVTGRPNAYEKPEQKLAGFQQADLEPMTETQIREFIRHWYLAARHANQWDEAQAQSRARQLAEEIFLRPYLPKMASTAMLLTLFIGLDYAGVRLPSSRAKLYEEAVELLLQRWNQNLKDYTQALDEAERQGLLVLERSRDEMLAALKKLAYETYKGLAPQAGQNSPATLEFSDIMVYGCLDKSFQYACDHDHLLYFLQYRSALLVAGGGEDNFQFAHRSFHEYLAASHLLEQPNWKEKTEELLRGNLDWWREVFLLLAKKYSDGQYGDAIVFLHRQLLGSYPATGHADAYQQRLLLLAATAAVELAIQDRQQEHDIYRQFHHFLQTELAGLLHSQQLAIAERAEAGRLLGELGDPRPGVTVQRANGQPIKRQRKGMEHELPDIDWQRIPAGRFRMGTDGEEGYDGEKPAHDVELPDFYISRYPISNAQYRCFVKAGLYEDADFWREKLPQAARQWWEGGEAEEKLLENLSENVREDYRNWLKRDAERGRPRFWEDKQWNLDNHPVVGVSWFEALAYSVWLNDELKEAVLPAGADDNLCIRLPAEDEWEYAARGTQGLRYAWGDEEDAKGGNYSDTGLQRTSTVGLFAPGQAFGVHDMSGNVWEWTLSRWGTDLSKPDFTYSDWQKQGKERNRLEPVEFRVVRGGSWYFRSDDVRCAFRLGGLPVNRSYGLGFRVLCGAVLPGSDS